MNPILQTAQLPPDSQFHSDLHYMNMSQYQDNTYCPCGFISNIPQWYNAPFPSYGRINPFAVSDILPTPPYALNDFGTEFIPAISQPQELAHDINKMLTSDSFPTVSGSIDGRVTPDRHQTRGSSNTCTDDEGPSPRSDVQEANITTSHVRLRMQRVNELRASLQPGQTQAVEQSDALVSIRTRAAKEGLLFKFWGSVSTGLIFSLTAGSSLGARADRESNPEPDNIDEVFERFYGYYDDSEKPSGEIRHLVYQLRSDQPCTLHACFVGTEESFAEYCRGFGERTKSYSRGEIFVH